MREESRKKCKYFNSCYCYFSKRKYGCKYFHPTLVCQATNCQDNSCNQRHPKKCKAQDKCMFQPRCLYSHTVTKNTHQEKETKQKKNMLDHIDKLKDDISKRKEDNGKNIIIHAKVHLMELENLQREPVKLRHELASVYKFHCTFCNFKRYNEISRHQIIHL